MMNPATIEQMAAWLKERDDFALLGHVCPDGDAAGSCLGLCHALRALGKRAVVCLPGGIPNLYADLPGADGVFATGDALPFEVRTAVAVDVSEYERLGDAGKALFDAAPQRAVIDHHSTNHGFGQLTLLDGAAASAGEIAVEVAEALGVKLSRDMATCLFVAISTDTGHFSYSNTRQETLAAASKCAAAGIDIAGITARLYRTRTQARTLLARLYRTRTQARTLLLGLVLAGLHVSEDGRIAWAFLTEAMLEQAHALREDNEGIVNYLQEIEGVVFAVLAEERGSETKLSMRSAPTLDVAKHVAVPLGGGGHPCAAGATVKLPMEAAAQRALELARRALG